MQQAVTGLWRFCVCSSTQIHSESYYIVRCVLCRLERKLEKVVRTTGKFSVTRSLVQKLVMAAFEQGKLSRKNLVVCTGLKIGPAVYTSKLDLSRKKLHCTHEFIVHTEQVKLVYGALLCHKPLAAWIAFFKLRPFVSEKCVKK